jgi:hypothetical protein
MEQWHTIPGFLGYSVSNLGHVRNDDTGRFLSIRRNQSGVCYVGMQKGLRQYRRSVAKLVAERFVSPPDAVPRNESDQPLHLDDDQMNNRADNLVWRPRWFVVSYTLQMNRGPQFPKLGEIIDTWNQEVYENPWAACVKFGLLETDLVLSITNRTYVYPTFQEFRFVPE